MYRPRVVPEKARVGKPLRKGKLVYHGTSEAFDPETLGEGFGGAWVSDSLEVAEWFAGWHTAEHTEPRRIHTYRVTQSPTLWVAKTPEQFAWLQRHYTAFYTEELTEAICRDGKDGWYLPDNYPTGADIFLCDPMQVLEYVETTELEPSGPRENAAWRPGVVPGSDWSVRVAEDNSFVIYNYRDKLPHGPPVATVIFQYPRVLKEEQDSFRVQGQIEVYAPQGADPERRVFPLSSGGMTVACQWLATFGIPPPPWNKADLRPNGRSEHAMRRNAKTPILNEYGAYVNGSAPKDPASPELLEWAEAHPEYYKEVTEAEDGYMQFQSFPVQEMAELTVDMPEKAYCLGPGIRAFYTSDKDDPHTRSPEKRRNDPQGVRGIKKQFVHEHDGSVPPQVFAVGKHAAEADYDDYVEIEWPRVLVWLGRFDGFDYEGPEGEPVNVMVGKGWDLFMFPNRKILVAFPARQVKNRHVTDMFIWVGDDQEVTYYGWGG